MGGEKKIIKLCVCVCKIFLCWRGKRGNSDNVTLDGLNIRKCYLLSEIGIERYSQKYCFWKYELDWGSCILLFARFGTTEDKLLDLLFEAIKKIHVSHLPEYYEMHYNFWNRESYDSVWVPKVTEILENKLEKILGK